MQTRFYIISGLIAVLCFVGGFLLANSLNKTEIAALNAKQAQNAKPAAEVQKTEGLELSEKEINDKLAEAEKSPADFNFQKGLGLALYRYAALKQDTKRLEDVYLLLERAYSINPDDYELLVSFANINYDLGQVKKDAKKTERARELYKKALQKNPKDVNVLADLGVSYLDSADAKPAEAMNFLKPAYDIDSRNEKVLAALARASIALEQPKESSEYLARLREINPKHPQVVQIDAELKTGASK